MPLTGLRNSAAVAGMLAVLGVVCLYVVAVGTAFGLHADGGVVPAKVTGGLFRAVLASAVDSINVVTAALATTSIVAIGARRGVRFAIRLGTAITGSVASAHLLALALGAGDPLGGEGARGYGAGYFPSGHATAIMVLALVGAMAAPESVRCVIALGGAAMAGVVGVGSLVTHAHYASDIVAGYLISLIWSCAAVAVSRPRGSPVSQRSSERPCRRRELVATLIIPAVLILGFVLERPPDQEASVGFAVVASGVALSATGVVGGFLVLLRRGGASTTGRGGA